MPFAFSQIEPRTNGEVSDMESPMSDYLGASFMQGMHDSIFGNLYRMRELSLAENDPGNQTNKLDPETATKRFGVGDLKFEEPVAPEVGQLLHDRKVAQMDRSFWLSQDNHSVLAGAAGMGTQMLGSMLNPVDFGMLFMPIVGEAGKVTEGASLLGRGGLVRQVINHGLITREGLQTMAPAAPKLAESIIQGMGYQALAEVPHQIASRQEFEDAGNPIAHILEGGAFAAGMHLTLSALGRVFEHFSPETKDAMLNKALDDFAKGKDIAVHDLAKLDEAYWDERRDVLNHNAAYENMQVKEAGYTPGVKVPETAPEPEQKQFTSVLDEIRHYDARTKAHIQRLFPEAKLSNEEAAQLRDQAWGIHPQAKLEQQIKDEQWDHIQSMLDMAKNGEQGDVPGVAKLRGQTRALLDAQDAIKDGQTLTPAQIEEHTVNATTPTEKDVSKVKEQATEAVAAVKPKKAKKAKVPELDIALKAIKNLKFGKEEDLVAAAASGKNVKDAIAGKEKVVAAAMKDKEGNLYTGTTHQEAFAHYVEHHKLPYETEEEAVATGKKYYPLLDDGFVTNKGRYLTRDETAALTGKPGEVMAQADELNKVKKQPPKFIGKPYQLLSESKPSKDLHFAFKLKNGDVIHAPAAAHFDLLGKIPEELHDQIVGGGFVQNGKFEAGGDFNAGIKPGETARTYYAPDTIGKAHTPEVIAARKEGDFSDSSFEKWIKDNRITYKTDAQKAEAKQEYAIWQKGDFKTNQEGRRYITYTNKYGTKVRSFETAQAQIAREAANDPEVIASLANNEKIVAAALRGPDNKLYTGHSHIEAFEKFVKEKKLPYKTDELMAQTVERHYPKFEQGFITNKGRFLDRDQTTGLTGKLAEAGNLGVEREEQAHIEAAKEPLKPEIIKDASDCLGKKMI